MSSKAFVFFNFKSPIQHLLDGRHPKRMYRISVGVFFFLQGLIFATWASRIPDIKDSLHLSDAMLGSLLLASPLGQMLAMSLSGYLIERFGSRRMMPVSIFLYPIALLGLGLAGHIATLALALFVFGISANLQNISINTQAVGVEYLYGRSIMGTFHGLWSLAGFSAGLIGTLMVSLNLVPWVHFAIVGILCWIIASWMLPYTLPRDISVSSRNRHTEDGNANASLNIFKGMTPYIALLGVLASGCMICEGTMYDWSSVFYAQIIDPPKELVRLGYTICMCTMATGRFFSDRFITRFGPIKVARVCGFLIFTGMMLMVLFPHIVVASIACFLIGFGISSVVPICYSMAGKTKTMSPSRALAAVSTIGFLGFLLGPPIIGFLASWLSLRYAFAFTACIGLATGLLAGKLKEK